MSFGNPKFESNIPAKLEAPVVPVLPINLESGDWSVEHHASISQVVSIDNGQRFEVRFFEKKHRPIYLDRDEPLPVIRGLST